MPTITITVYSGDKQKTIDVEYNLKTTFREWEDKLRELHDWHIHDIKMYAAGTQFEFNYTQRHGNQIAFRGYNGYSPLVGLDEPLYIDVNLASIDEHIAEVQAYRAEWVALLTPK